MEPGSNLLTRVRGQYEAYPFPVRRPQDERRSLIPSEVDRLGRIDHFCHGGRRDFERPYRVLVAGGGTGDALIHLGEQLRGKPCELVYLDLSSASMEIARARAAARELDKVTWIRGSILELPRLDLGEFDYVNCIGVLHHLEDPAQGLRQLSQLLAEDGGMGLMLYGKYGRRSVYLLREVLSLLNDPGEDFPTRVNTARRTLTDLIAHRVIEGSPEALRLYASSESDAYLVDTYLHEQDRPFTVAQIHALLEACGLHLSGFTNFFDRQGAVCALEYDPSCYLTDPELLERIARRPLAARQHLAEILNGTLSMHAFYATRRPGAAASLADVDNAPYFPTSYGVEVARGILASGSDQVEVRLQNGLVRGLSIGPPMRAVLSGIDGRRSVGELCRRAAGITSGEPAARGRREVLSVLDLMGSLGLVLLRQASLDPLPAQAVQRRWNGAIDLRPFSVPGG